MARITPLSKKREIYSDFPKDMYLNPVSYDLSRKNNEESVKEAIKNLILTNKGERPFQPNLGSNLRKILFENYTPATNKIAKEYITDTIKRYEPRAELLDVSLIWVPDMNAVQVQIAFGVSMVEDPITMNVIVDRIR